jgi:hypothetical protein
LEQKIQKSRNKNYKTGKQNYKKSGNKNPSFFFKNQGTKVLKNSRKKNLGTNF